MRIEVLKIKFKNWKFGTLNFDVKIWRNKMEMWVPLAWKRVGRYLSGGNSERKKK